MRAEATTEPGRLLILGAVLAALVVVFGAVTAYEVSDRAAAADDVVSRSQPLSADAADIYRSLADADTAAAGGFLAGAQEPADVRERYERDITTASRLLIKAAANTDGSSRSARDIATLNEHLPRYTGLVERARAANRQGLPLGGAYLRYANQQMSTHLLPAAERLYEAETARLDQDDRSARGWPFLSLALGVVVVAALLRAQRRTYLRTNRVFNRGLLAATVASTVMLLWLAAGHTLARAGLNEARAHGQDSLKVLNEARINSLKARANENLTVVARGAVLTADGKRDKYETEYGTGMGKLSAALAEAGRLADDSAGGGPVADAVQRVEEWKKRHEDARDTDDAGDYEGALAKVIGVEDSTGESFDQVDAALKKALAHEQGEFTRAAEDGRGALTGLPVGAGALAVVGAAGAIMGINRRLSEYR
ncbi:hypothetical protein QWM81_23490 [Streptomyces ficellus]|uniref:Secreted protein n=1 Tax=Streptomyces ficellus TaxID=1977088 RepID=A0ABT7ZBS5_9ACTN|nr:hypothetical protein [Streptomyces ficellus]MDN3296954.1 hypothetical protein [Streptomyces ficellus]